MSGTKQSELEGLANRIALLVGDDGEAESAGRAVGMMARRLGLSGGHLKAIFMAGAGSLGAAAKQTAELAARAERLSGETQGLEHSLEQLEIALHQANRERDALRAEVGSLELALDGARSGRRLQLTLGGLLLLAVLVGGGYAWFGLAQPGDSGGGGPVAASDGPRRGGARRRHHGLCRGRPGIGGAREAAGRRAPAGAPTGVAQFQPVGANPAGRAHRLRAGHGRRPAGLSREIPLDRTARLL